MTYLTLTEIVDLVKEKIIKNRLTIQEISENSGVEQNVIEFLLNPDNTLVNDLSRIIDFTKIGLKEKNYQFNIYTITKEETQFKITRNIKPKCSIYFDSSTQEFYRFSLKYKKHNSLSILRKNLIMSEMKEKLEEYENNND